MNLSDNIVQTLILDYSRLPFDRRPLDRSSNHSSDRSVGGSSRDQRLSYTPHRPFGSSPTAVSFLPEHQTDFLT